SGDIVRRVVNEHGSVGMRVYYAIDDQGKKQLLLVGVDADGNNLLPQEGTAATNRTEDDGPIIVDLSQPCPINCPTNGL
ncbi:MAG TPA: hypothetical protein VFM90_02370, partial [Cyclobacteriaceae bacterium]|nr:hypothetical protein [Cyclobacteriaceae bacterium]